MTRYNDPGSGFSYAPASCVYKDGNQSQPYFTGDQVPSLCCDPASTGTYNSTQVVVSKWLSTWWGSDASYYQSPNGASASVNCPAIHPGYHALIACDTDGRMSYQEDCGTASWDVNIDIMTLVNCDNCTNHIATEVTPGSDVCIKATPLCKLGIRGDGSTSDCQDPGQGGLKHNNFVWRNACLSSSGLTATNPGVSSLSLQKISGEYMPTGERCSYEYSSCYCNGELEVSSGTDWELIAIISLCVAGFLLVIVTGISIWNCCSPSSKEEDDKVVQRTNVSDMTAPNKDVRLDAPQSTASMAMGNEVVV